MRFFERYVVSYVKATEKCENHLSFTTVETDVGRNKNLFSLVIILSMLLPLNTKAGKRK